MVGLPTMSQLWHKTQMYFSCLSSCPLGFLCCRNLDFFFFFRLYPNTCETEPAPGGNKSLLSNLGHIHAIDYRITCHSGWLKDQWAPFFLNQWAPFSVSLACQGHLQEASRICIRLRAERESPPLLQHPALLLGWFPLISCTPLIMRTGLCPPAGIRTLFGTLFS